MQSSPLREAGPTAAARRPNSTSSLPGDLIYHSLAALCRFQHIDRVSVILSPADRWWRQHDWTSLGHKLETIYGGGATRSESVANGLRAAATAAADDDWMLVHKRSASLPGTDDVGCTA